MGRTCTVIRPSAAQKVLINLTFSEVPIGVGVGVEGSGVSEDSLGKNVPSSSAVACWCAEFKRGRTSIKDDLHSGRPGIAVTEEMVAKIARLYRVSSYFVPARSTAAAAQIDGRAPALAGRQVESYAAVCADLNIHEMEYTLFDEMEYTLFDEMEYTLSDDMEYTLFDEMEYTLSDDMEYTLFDEMEYTLSDEMEYTLFDEMEYTLSDDMEYTLFDEMEYTLSDEMEYTLFDEMEYTLSDEMECTLSASFFFNKGSRR
ncbi:S-antigen protein [Eumeta japonica]|uniref:S-antigen protein n=1 Tax=Eumeta variegata TaxID=151549 RepID=A0A4C1XM18_EUMVA|nr:S-antigen protein [Eumeta japonica]